MNPNKISICQSLQNRNQNQIKNYLKSYLHLVLRIQKVQTILLPTNHSPLVDKNWDPYLIKNLVEVPIKIPEYDIDNNIFTYFSNKLTVFCYFIILFKYVFSQY